MSGIYRSAEARAIALGRYEKRLEAVEDRVASTMVETAPLWTHVLLAGDEQLPSLLLIPGSGGCALDFVDALLPLAEHFRCAFVDVPGEPGRSTEVRLGKGEAAAQWLASLVGGLGWARPAVLAMSGGALPVLRSPGLFGRAVLLVPEGLSRASFPQRLRDLVWPGVRHRVWPTENSRRALGAAACEPEDPAFAAVCDQMDRALRDRVPALPPAPPLPDEALAAFTTAALVVAATGDRIFPGPALAQRARRLPAARVEQVDGGHVSAGLFAPGARSSYAEFLLG